ncbi:MULTISPECIES: ABC transporter permease [unclassified Streptomyces]|uniref:ABC transporter permease n=1 Tax=unclassified Streptomyces TaxID=2593676 RepID=UPI002DDC6957|nr:ABC transporter permease [Streptomyces sp. NBC_01750]WSA98499.1 ABC transporter permease [Streptomyces sp. NBC_01794]WSD36964.1 ABC transporter permease [Streptomyces sp. NBC_01750]
MALRKRPEEPRPRSGPSASGTRLWTWLMIPGTLWMTGFLIASLLLVATLAFGTTDPLGNPRFGLNFENIAAMTDPAYRAVLLRSLGYALLTCLICLVVAYPVAYAIALHGGRFKNLLIAAIVVPFFANYLVRMYGWSVVLSDDGPLLKVLRAVGLADSDTKILQTGMGVIAGLVYGFIVFMIIPLYAALERMDVSLIEAGRDLYGGPLRTFFFVTLPATRQGAMAGCVLVLLPAMGDFVSAQLMGGPDQIMIGNLIQDKFFQGQNWPLGSALTMLMMAVLFIGMLGYLRRTRKDEAEATR